MKLKYLVAILLLGIIIWAIIYNNSLRNDKKEIVIFQILEHEALNMTRRGIEDHLHQCCNDFDIRYENAQGNLSLALQIGKKISNSDPKVIVAIGTVAAQSFLKNNKNPVIFSSVTDPIKAGLVQSIESPGRHFSGVSNTIDVDIQLKLIKDIMPTATNIGFIYNPSESNSVEILGKIKNHAGKFNFNIVEAAINSSNDVFIATQTLIDKNIDAIFISNDNTALSSISGIIKVAGLSKIPVFCSDTDTINSGVLASVGPNQYNIGIQTGKMIERIIMNNENPKDIAVEFPHNIELKINLDTAKKLDIIIQNDLIKDASEVIK